MEISGLLCSSSSNSFANGRDDVNATFRFQIPVGIHTGPTLATSFPRQWLSGFGDRGRTLHGPADGFGFGRNFIFGGSGASGRFHGRVETGCLRVRRNDLYQRPGHSDEREFGQRNFCIAGAVRGEMCRVAHELEPQDQKGSVTPVRRGRRKPVFEKSIERFLPAPKLPLAMHGSKDMGWIL